MSMGLLFDATRCVACMACTGACKEQNKLPGPVEPEPTAYTWTTVQQRAGLNVRRLCMHCEVPTCVSVCPVGALVKTKEGPVVYDSEKCMGCRYCMMACPFTVPKYQWDKPVPIIGKCIMCAPRVKEGKPTACAEACQFEATVFGKREDLVKEAKARIAKDPGAYLDHVYGITEAGGTDVILLTSPSAPFEKLGYRTDLPTDPPAMRTWQVLSNIPDFIAVWGVFLYGIHWITGRREEVKAGPPPHEDQNPHSSDQGRKS